MRQTPSPTHWHRRAKGYVARLERGAKVLVKVRRTYDAQPAQSSRDRGPGPTTVTTAGCDSQEHSSDLVHCSTRKQPRSGYAGLSNVTSSCGSLSISHSASAHQHGDLVSATWSSSWSSSRPLCPDPLWVRCPLGRVPRRRVYRVPPRLASCRATRRRLALLHSAGIKQIALGPLGLQQAALPSTFRPSQMTGCRLLLLPLPMGRWLVANVSKAALDLQH